MRLRRAGAVSLLAAAGFAMHELALFAATGMVLLGIGDLLVDLLWLGMQARRMAPLRITDVPPPAKPGRIAIFVPAWDESEVIGDMLRHSLRTFRHTDYVIYVGLYPNDPKGLAAVREVADYRIRAVVGSRPGPTTKADCLNSLWRRMLADEALEGPVRCVVLHDAEDVVHADSLRLFDALISGSGMVQIPVIPLIDANSRWIGGHYADEFAESHGKELLVRQAIGAAIPSAGVGCAFARDALARIAALNGDEPFDAASLTEDYELGLRLAALGWRSRFVRVVGEDGSLIATKEYFPGALDGAVRQKARWMTGIALSGWHRLGWRGGPAEIWMRLRDRQSLLAAALLCAAYLAATIYILIGLATGASPRDFGPFLDALLRINLLLLAWRLTLRFGFTGATHGWREGLRAMPRIMISNIVAMLAACLALLRYRTIRRTGVTAWDKTSHAFPAELRR